MKVTITRKVDATEEVDIDFPLYLAAGDDGFDSWYRIDADGLMTSITEWFERAGEGVRKSSLEVTRIDLRTSLVYYLNSHYSRLRGPEASQPFNEALARHAASLPSGISFKPAE